MTPAQATAKAGYIGYVSLSLFCAAVALSAAVVRDDNSPAWRAGLLLAGLAALAVTVVSVVRARRDRAETAERQVDARLPAWVAELPEERYLELERAMDQINRQLRHADLSTQEARRRASQSRSNVWQIVASAVASEERTRARFVADLHDSVVQTIIICAYQAEDPDVDREELAESLHEAEHQLRELMVLTRPPDLVRGDLGTAVTSLCRTIEFRHGLVTEWDWPPAEVELPAAIAHTLYRFYQESLNNVAKHADVKRAEAGLTVGRQIVAWVRDEGTGFAVSSKEQTTVGGEHVGLDLMNTRADQLGAEVLIDSSPGVGTTVTLSIEAFTLDDDRPVTVGTTPLPADDALAD